MVALITIVIIAACSRSPYANINNPKDEYVGYTDVYPVYIDSRFSDKQKSDIKAGIEAWNYTLNGYRRYEIISDKFDAAADLEVIHSLRNSYMGLVVLYETADDPEIEDGVLAWVPDFGALDMHVVADRISGRNLIQIVEHELGHILGSPHVNIARSSMYPYYPVNNIPCIDYITASLVANGHKLWDIHHMNYCMVQ